MYKSGYTSVFEAYTHRETRPAKPIRVWVLCEVPRTSWRRRRPRLPRLAPRCLRDHVHGFFESDVHGGYEQAEDVLAKAPVPSYGTAVTPAPPSQRSPVPGAAPEPLFDVGGGAFSMPYSSTTKNTATEVLKWVSLVIRRREPSWGRWHECMHVPAAQGLQLANHRIGHADRF